MPSLSPSAKYNPMLAASRIWQEKEMWYMSKAKINNRSMYSYWAFFKKILLFYFPCCSHRRHTLNENDNMTPKKPGISTTWILNRSFDGSWEEVEFGQQPEAWTSSQQWWVRWDSGVQEWTKARSANRKLLESLRGLKDVEGFHL